MGDDIKQKAGSDLVRNGLISALMIMLSVIAWVGNNATNYIISDLKHLKGGLDEVKTEVTQIGTRQDVGRVEWDEKAQVAFKGIEKALANDARQDIQLNSHDHRLTALERLRHTTNN